MSNEKSWGASLLLFRSDTVSEITLSSFYLPFLVSTKLSDVFIFFRAYPTFTNFMVSVNIAKTISNHIYPSRTTTEGNKAIFYTSFLQKLKKISTRERRIFIVYIVTFKIFCKPRTSSGDLMTVRCEPRKVLHAFRQITC